MSTPINAAPQTIYQGIDDESKRAQSFDAQATPTHLPLHFLYTQWGPTDGTLVSSSSLAATFGDTFNQRQPWFNHNSLFAQEELKQGNQVMIKRLLPADVGPKARVLLSLDIVAEPALPQYQRNADGTYKLDQNGNKLPVSGAGATAPGFIGKWVLNQWLTTPTEEVFGKVATRQGSIVNSTSQQSQLYPVLEFEATFFGSLGNNLGMRLIAPTTEDTSPLNSAMCARVNSYIYRMQFVQRTSPLSSPTVIANQNGSQWTDVSFLPGAYDPNTDLNLDFQYVLSNSYSQHDIVGQPDVWGPFENAHVYQDNLASILAQIGAVEAPHGTLPVTTMDANSPELYTVNPFTAVNYDGVPYYSLTLQNATQGGLIFTPNSTNYGAGASDGTMSLTTYDADVATAIAGFDMQDMAKFPFSFIYDSGFSLQTKYAIIGMLGQRPDIALVMSTQSALDPQNTPDEDSSMAQALAAYIGNYPESTVYGTAACRAMIVGSSGYLLNSNYTKLVPLTLQIASRFSAYMGAANGQWDSSVPPDENPYNIVNLFKKVNAAYKNPTARSKDWTTGLVWVENFDMNTQYFPALASVYPNDTSILKAFMNVVVAIDLVKIAHAVRRQLSGISRLTDAQFVARSNQLIQAAVKGRYAGRVSVVPNTFYSTQDQQNGYSWSCEITMYGNNMRTVGSDTIIARRMSDLTTTTTNG